MNIEVFYSKKTDDWKTPSELYKVLMDKGYIDPCPFQAKEDGLKKEYFAKKLFINPPFSKMNDWINYGIRQHWYNHCEVLFLIPARTDTKYFHELLSYSPDIYFIKGRLHYNDSRTGAPFPSILLRLFYENPRERNYYHMDLDYMIYLIKIDKLFKESK